MFILSIVVNIGMWFERFVIIVTSLHRDFMPANWTMYHPTWVELNFRWNHRSVLLLLPVIRKSVL